LVELARFRTRSTLSVPEAFGLWEFDVGGNKVKDSVPDSVVTCVIDGLLRCVQNLSQEADRLMITVFLQRSAAVEHQ
jgi:hypothetical protein